MAPSGLRYCPLLSLQPVNWLKIQEHSLVWLSTSRVPSPLLPLQFVPKVLTKCSRSRNHLPPLSSLSDTCCCIIPWTRNLVSLDTHSLQRKCHWWSLSAWDFSFLTHPWTSNLTELFKTFLKTQDVAFGFKIPVPLALTPSPSFTSQLMSTLNSLLLLPGMLFNSNPTVSGKPLVSSRLGLEVWLPLSPMF